MKVKGLVLDGGGVFGIVQAHILGRIDLSEFDFFVGTSIGAAQAIFLGLDVKKPSKLPAFFHDRMPEIFKGHWYKTYKLFTPKYSDKALNKALQELLPGAFGDCIKPVFITAVDLNSQKLKVFYSEDSTDASWPAWEVARAATAAETYFSSWKGYADGAIFANNPSMVAIAAACKKLGCKVSDIELCSIGTGYTDKIDKPPSDHSFILSWGKWVLDALLGGASNSMHEYFARSMPLKQYCRHDFLRQNNWRIDNPKQMLEAEKAWKSSIAATVKDIKEKF